MAVKNPLSAYEHFAKNGVWRELVEIVEERIEASRDDLESIQETVTLEEVRLLQGRICEDRFFLAQLPDMIEVAKYLAKHPAVPNEALEEDDHE